MWVMHRKRARRILGDLKKSVELSPASGEDGWLSLARRGLVSGAHVVWGRWKNQVYLSPYVEKPLNSKVIKSFVPELRSRVFRVSGFLCSMYICYEHSMYISHISVSWVWYKVKSFHFFSNFVNLANFSHFFISSQIPSIFWSFNTKAKKKYYIFIWIHESTYRNFL